MGTRKKPLTLLGFDLAVKTGFKPRWTGEGAASQIFSRAAWLPNKGSDYEITCKIEMEYNATALAEIVNWRARTARAIEIKLEGPALTTNGTTYSKKTVRIQMYGSWDDFSGLEDNDGGDSVTGTFRAHYHPTPAAVGNVVCVNELSSLT